MANAKIKLKTDWKSHKAGDKIECNWVSAFSLVDAGSAVFVGKDPRKKTVASPRKHKMVTGKKTSKK